VDDQRIRIHSRGWSNNISYFHCTHFSKIVRGQNKEVGYSEFVLQARERLNHFVPELYFNFAHSVYKM